MNFKILILSFLLFISPFTRAQTVQLTNFEALMESLNSGENVRVVVNYKLCEWAEGENDKPAIPDAIVGMNIDIYEYFAPGSVRNKLAFVVFSQAKLIQNPVGKGFVYNYGKIKIYSDNSVQINAKYIHPKSFKVLMNETFVAKINDGNNSQAVNLFK